MVLRIDGEIEIDREGRVRSHRLDTKLVEGLRIPVDRAVARWTFMPPSLPEGQDTVRSPMQITLAARALDKGYALTVDKASFRLAEDAQVNAEGLVAQGDLVIVSARPKPRPPGYRVLADVIVEIRVDRSGRIMDVVPTRCTILGLDTRMPPALACADLESRSVAASKQWTLRYEPGQADPVEEVISGQVTVRYTGRGITMNDADGKWREQWRTQHRPAPWRKEKPHVDPAAVVEGEPVRGAQGLKLRDGIIGQAL